MIQKIMLTDRIQTQPVYLKTIATKLITEPPTINRQVTLPNNLQKKLDKLLDKFPEVFNETPGQIKGYSCVIRQRQ